MFFLAYFIEFTVLREYNGGRKYLLEPLTILDPSCYSNNAKLGYKRILTIIGVRPASDGGTATFLIQLFLTQHKSYSIFTFLVGLNFYGGGRNWIIPKLINTLQRN